MFFTTVFKILTEVKFLVLGQTVATHVNKCENESIIIHNVKLLW